MKKLGAMNQKSQRIEQKKVLNCKLMSGNYIHFVIDYFKTKIGVGIL